MSRNITDGESDHPFLKRFDNGHGSIDGLYEYPEFRKKLGIICQHFSFNLFDGTYGRDDLYQDVCIKVLKSERKLLKPGNIVNETDFYGWLFVVTRNQYLSRVRYFSKNGLVRDASPVEDLDVPATDDDTEGRYFLKRFLRFLKRYPVVQRTVVRLWLQGYSYREIEKKFQGTTSSCSHVTVGNWVHAILDDFRKSLGFGLPTVSPSGTTTKTVGVGRSIAGQ